jgi:adenylate cyclase
VSGAGTRLLTIVATDLVRSTELFSRAGDERAHRIVRAHHDVLIRAVQAHGGEEIVWLGDGLTAAFGSAIDAVRCAVAIQESARRPLRGEYLAIRVGIHTGEVSPGDVDRAGGRP